jgi:4-aminobutyrate--pyruvate transaminase
VPPPSYFPKLQAVLKKHDILLVADEVICGFGRTGHWFGCDTYGIRPDIMTVAKALSSSYVPISGTLMTRPIYDALVDGSKRNGVFSHGFTYSGHPVAAAVANEALKIYESDRIIEHVRQVAPRFQQRLHALEGHPMVASTRGVGLVGALEVVRDKATRAPFTAESGVLAQLGQAVLANGLVSRPLRDAMALCPPLIITEPQIDELFDKLTRSLDQTLEFARARGALA